MAIAAVSLAVAGLAYIDEQDFGSWAIAPAVPRAVAVTPTPPPIVPVAEAGAAAASKVKAVEPQSAVIEVVAEAAPAAALTDVAATGATIASKPASPVKASPRQPDRASKPSKRAVSPTKRGDTKLAKAASAQKDPDVDLIEALVSHVAGKDAAAARVRVADAGTPKAGARDVVLQQQPALPTSELVRRCMTLGWLESQLCRARICSGQWGQDSACPSAQQQSAEFRR
ncbi:hypothetical protein M8A51_09705 [Schlegelella sp. S2-27]|uniref:Uncharacterized protein n=1 Tax=Caldimonas mangrovi TaxID=2944811 RepID=A0ABT0YM48_9BURK|nr:hypothetical protein [Caldimonas mangrovi]MCM5679807.1 hypothetical protein [Caldimonas mangrovi]